MAVNTFSKEEPLSRKNEVSGVLKELSKFTERLILRKSSSKAFPVKQKIKKDSETVITRDLLKAEILKFFSKKSG